METTLSSASASRLSTPTRTAVRAEKATPGGVSRVQLWTGRSLSGLAVLFLGFDTVLKIVQAPQAIEGSMELGFAASTVFGIGVIEAVCLAAYLIPRTAVLGAVLFTGYLGGAIATHVRLDNPLFTHQLFPIYIAALLWGGLYLRDANLRALLPLRKAV